MEDGNVPTVLDVLDLGALAGARVERRAVLALHLGEREIRVRVSTLGQGEFAEAWKRDNPEPKRVPRTLVVRSGDQAGKDLAAAGYKGPWPAIREVQGSTDEASDKAHDEWALRLTWAVVAKSMPEIRGQDGRNLTDEAARIEALRSLGLTDAHAVKIANTILRMESVEVFRSDEEAAGFFDERSERRGS